MCQDLRFTGKYPPFEFWEEFPNWEFALDEEDVEGQDETTLRPAEVQDYISESVSHTVGEVELANGKLLPAMLYVFEGPVNEVHGFVAENIAWLIRFGAPEPRWVSYVEEWLPANERSPTVSFDDPNIFPIKVRSRLPRKHGESPICFVINSDGEASEL